MGGNGCGKCCAFIPRHKIGIIEPCNEQTLRNRIVKNTGWRGNLKDTPCDSSVSSLPASIYPSHPANRRILKCDIGAALRRSYRIPCEPTVGGLKYLMG